MLPGDRQIPGWRSERPEFEAAVLQATREAQGDGRMILGVADRVPVDAGLDRLEAISALVERALDERRGG